MATKYEYDSAGKLSKVYTEVADIPNNLGGFKLVKEYNMNYKEEEEIPVVNITGEFNFKYENYYTDDPFGQDEEGLDLIFFLNNVNGNQGDYQIQWSYKIDNEGSTYQSLGITQINPFTLSYNSTGANDIIMGDFCGKEIKIKCLIIDSEGNYGVIETTDSLFIECDEINQYNEGQISANNY